MISPVADTIRLPLAPVPPPKNLAFGGPHGLGPLSQVLPLAPPGLFKPLPPPFPPSSESLELEELLPPLNKLHRSIGGQSISSSQLRKDSISSKKSPPAPPPPIPPIPPPMLPPRPPRTLEMLPIPEFTVFCA
ncbi:MAG: hypothetical protein EB168_10445 [Euryarchaeota archaeon]|nr:hypothetical protein [Euryarchaeota archaeon]